MVNKNEKVNGSPEGNPEETTPKADPKPKVEDKDLEKEEMRKAGASVAQLELAKLEQARKEFEIVSKEVDRKIALIKEFNKSAAVRGGGLATGDTKEETADEKWKREAKIRYAGTGMDPTT